MKVLVIKSVGAEELEEALAFVGVQWPDASAAVLAERPPGAGDGDSEKKSKALGYVRDARARPRLSREMRRRIREQRFDLCVMSFHDRAGARYWTFRTLPLRVGIPRIVGIAGDHTVWSSPAWAWALGTLWACMVLRVLQLRPPESVREVVNYTVDYGMMILMTALALLAAGLKAVRLHPLAWQVRRAAHESPFLFIFIPHFGLGGAQKMLITFLRHIDLQKYRVELCTLDGAFKFFEPQARSLPVPLTYLPCQCGFPYWKVIWVLTRRLTQTRPDVVIGWLPWATVFAAIAGSLAGVPRLLTSLRSESPARMASQPLPWVRPLDILTVPMIDTVVACSNACREDYIAWAKIPPKKIVTVYNGVDEAELRQPGSAEVQAIRRELGLEDAPVVGIVGRLSLEKDQRTFLAAMRSVREAVPGVQALVVGDGSDRDLLIAETQRLGLGDCVQFLGARTDVLPIIASLDVLALTSRTEGFPVVLLEAQMLGVPVVTTAAGGAQEAVRDGETGFVVPCGDAAAVGSRIVCLLEDDGLRRRLGEAGRTFVRNTFSADRMTADLLRLCRL